MSNLLQQSWTESEKITLLINILQGAVRDVPAYLLQGIVQNGLQPRWEDIALPEGRSLNACRHTYEDLKLAMQPTGSLHSPRHFAPFHHMRMGANPTPTRAASDHDIRAAPQRAIQPRPPRTSNSPRPPATNGESFTIISAYTPDQMPERRRKRGRPTKEEAEERDRRLAASGQTYERKKRPAKKARPSETPGSLSEFAATTSPQPHTPFLQLETGHEVSSGRRSMRPQDDDESSLPAQPRSPPDDSGNERSLDVVPSPSDRLLLRSNLPQAIPAVTRDMPLDRSPTLRQDRPPVLPSDEPPPGPSSA
ncbi:hypothetical protein PV10_03278 [Exophiala mesophila]|uniref:Myb-like domain-containing protein n=1 Tax=Exophiala mesophila TaxID=212818 RepID=A0A0D1ZLZ9_EXOME|nr:uncharacterized protein PV10_03278 [Exophiala mesophila]KIV95652.1 hypothetical protein PV10_03278 [Exophiala mesophila]